MKTKLLLLVVIIFSIITMICSNTRADDKNRKSDKSIWTEQNENAVVSLAPYNYAPEPAIFTIQLDPGFQTDSYVIGPEILTQINGFYDYKTNGETNHYLQVDPSTPLNLHSVDVQADTLDPTGATSRRTYYAVSSNGGETWDQLGQVPDIRSGYPVLKLKNGAALIANHNTAATGVVNVSLYLDIIPQGGSFTQFPGTLPNGIWPQIATFNNGNAGVLSRPQHISGSDYDTLFFQIWNGTTMGPKSVLYISDPPYVGTVGSNMRFNIAQNNAGRVTVAISSVLEDDTLGNSKIWARTSTDNGVSWGPLQLIFSPFIENSEDTVAVAGGGDLVYKPNSNTWVYSVAATADDLYEKGRIYIIKSDGTRSVMTTATEVNATTSFASAMAFVFNIDQPSLGYSADGNVLYCVYAVVKSDLGASGFNSRDIYYQRSLDDGTTWGPPVRVTNTPTIDECYPSVSDWNKGSSTDSYELNFTYMKDPGVGPCSFNGSSTLAPVSRNFQIYRKITNANIIGISNNQTDLNEYKLNQNYPNPFNPSTKISYNLTKNGFVTLKIYDALGKEVQTLVNDFQQTGYREVEFNASGLSSGVYYYRLSSGDFSDVKKMMLIK